MKKLIALAALMVALPASAMTCEELSDYAAEVMAKRQDEVSMVDVMKEAKTDVQRSVVLSAYQRPSFVGDKWKSKTIKSFANDVAASCYALSI